MKKTFITVLTLGLLTMNQAAAYDPTDTSLPENDFHFISAQQVRDEVNEQQNLTPEDMENYQKEVIDSAIESNNNSLDVNEPDEDFHFISAEQVREEVNEQNQPDATDLINGN